MSIMSDGWKCSWSLGWNLWVKRETTFTNFSKLLTSSNSGRFVVVFKCFFVPLKTNVFRFVWIQVTSSSSRPLARDVILRMLTCGSGNKGLSPRWIHAFSWNFLANPILIFQYPIIWNKFLRFSWRQRLVWPVGCHHRNSVCLYRCLHLLCYCRRWKFTCSQIIPW